MSFDVSNEGAPPSPVDLQLSRLVEPRRRRVLGDGLGDGHTTDDQLLAAGGEAPRRVVDWTGRGVDHGDTIRHALLAMSIVVVLGLAVLAFIRSAL